MQNKFLAHVRKYDGAEQTVAEHLKQTAELAKTHAEKIDLPLMGELCGLLHDLGKYSEEFQKYIRSAAGLINPDAEEFVDAKGKKGKIDHSTAGAQLVWENGSQKNLLEIFLRQLPALCIASHHSGLLDCIKPDDGVDRFSKRMEKDDQTTHLSEVRNKIDTEILQRIEDLIQSPEIRAELKAQAQKVLKTEPINHMIRDFRHGMLARFLFSCLIDADRTDTIDFVKPELIEEKWKGEYLDWEALIEALESRIAEFKVKNEVNKLRTEISSTCQHFGQREKGLYSLTVPTGGGKTLASLRFALHHAQKNKMSRIIYVVPYTSIIDQNADEVRKIFKELSQTAGKEIVLEHHSNLAPEKETPQGRLIAENWDARIIYTTAVQFLEALFGSGTRGVRRMHQLANAVIVFDEIQTLPVRIVHLFNNAINFLIDLCGSTVVFCTATQPCLDKVDPT
ncbi:CRISPR-associated endonuclease Cas3'', partial [candidate division KSB3 bacterium]|nr:CRISPR-associated endonuclease Cas3'' [candidate division KSB3 bacterium]MBD3323524.1 CRISPR-associated endonuclease Cas3'' [candidate division KSB3 bacterium]